MKLAILLVLFSGKIAVLAATADHGLKSVGDSEVGKDKIYQYGCGGCHRIPGVSKAIGIVGPDLKGVRTRNYIGGVANNTAENMVEWIVNPQGISPKTAMPNPRVTRMDARDIAAYLYTLK